MTSVIVRSTTRVLIALLMLLSVFLLLRGHNVPGGGFIGGLVGAAAFALYAMSYGASAARYVLRVDPWLVIGVGLAVAVLSGFVAAFVGQAFLAGQWLELPVGGLKIGTPLLFDIGVYLVVIGVVLKMIFALEEVA